jgi:hypothetical protein
MADQLYLSYSINGYNIDNMLRHYEKMLRLFPYSRLQFGASVFKVIPISYSEPARIEGAYTMPEQIDEALVSAKEFLNADSCYRLEAFWDLWHFEKSEWKLAPSRVALNCFGPAFEDAEANLAIEFGIDAQFLPEPGVPNSLKMSQQNIKSLLKLVHDLDDALNVNRRRLWTETGENFAEQLQEALLEAG